MTQFIEALPAFGICLALWLGGTSWIKKRY